MEKKFSNLHSGEEACLYTIQNGGLTAKIIPAGFRTAGAARGNRLR